MCIEESYTGSSRWSRGYVSGYWLIIGSRYSYGRQDNKKRVKIGDGKVLGINAKQLAKAKVALAEVKAVEDRKNAMRNAKESDEERTKAFIAANPEFCKLVGRSYYCSGETYYGHGGRPNTYTTAFIYTVEGRVKIGCETFTVAQWTEIYNLRNSQAVAMKSLKDSFAQK